MQHAHIITVMEHTLGGRSMFAEKLSTMTGRKVDPSIVAAWKARNQIAGVFHLPIWLLASRHSVEIDPTDFYQKPKNRNAITKCQGEDV